MILTTKNNFMRLMLINIFLPDMDPRFSDQTNNIKKEHVPDPRSKSGNPTGIQRTINDCRFD